MSKYNAKAILLGLQSVVSKEDNDLNITINADHEGEADSGEGEAVDLAPEPAPVETVEETTPVEGEVTEEPIVDAAEEVSEDTSGTPEAAELDVQEAAETVDETQEQIENVNEATEGLEALAITLAQISVEGLDVSPIAATLLNQQYDFAVRKFPALRASSMRVASCEDFAISQEDATTVSLEKVMDGIKNGVKAIIAFLKDLGQKFLAMLGHVLSASAVMKRKAQALQSQAKGFKGAPKEVSVAGLLTSKELSVASIKELADALNAIGTKGYEALASGDGAIGANAHVDSVKAFFGKTFIGGFKIENTNGGPGLTAVEGKEGTKAKLAAAEAGALAGAVVNLATAIEAYKRGEGIRKNVVKKLTDEATALSNAAGGENAGKIQGIRKRMKAVSELMNFEKRLIGKALAVGNATNNVIAAAIDGKATGDAQNANDVPRLPEAKKK